MRKIIKSCKGFIKSIFGGVIFFSVKLLSIVNKKPQVSKEYITLNTEPDDVDKPAPPPPPPVKIEESKK